MAEAFAKGHGVGRAWEHMIGEEGRLKDEKAGTWWMQCKIAEKHCVEVGDHTVLIGEVLDAANYSSGAENHGMIYLAGAYRGVGDVLSSGVERR